MTWLRPTAPALDRELGDERLVDVGVRGRIALDEILGVPDDLDGLGRADKRHRRGDVDRHRRSGHRRRC